MKSALSALTITLLLTACGNAPPESAVANPDTAASSSSGSINQSIPLTRSPASSPPQSPSVQTLISRDNKISLTIRNGKFTDIIDNIAAYPNDLNADELTLLQHDDSRDITVYTANLGPPQTNADSYFANLKKALESANNLQQVRTGIATENRMNYRFTQTNSNGKTLSENCIAIYETHLYNICASSTTATQEQLADTLKDVNLIK